MKKLALFLLFFAMNFLHQVLAQSKVEWVKLPDLPDVKGRAGMFAGVSHNALIAIGGANFPEKMPWEGGKKRWYNDIFVLEKGGTPKRLPTQLAAACGYGASVSYQNQLLLFGGSNQDGHLTQAEALEWNGTDVVRKSLPALPYPLAQMGGLVLNDMVILIGGNQTPTAAPLKTCLVLDLQQTAAGWKEILFPGEARIFPMCGKDQQYGYVFSGETSDLNRLGHKYRAILTDAYRFELRRENGQPVARWESLAPMPRGASAGGATVPLLKDGRFFFWGGVDGMTGAWRTPPKHPGIIKSLMVYHPTDDTWEYVGEQKEWPSRVTLPVVEWEGVWVYVSGEILPGVRTPSLMGVR